MKVYTRKRHLFQPAQEQPSYEAHLSPTSPKMAQSEVESNLKSGGNKAAKSGSHIDLPIPSRRLKLLLAKEFEIKDLGHLRYFLGIEVSRSRLGILVSQ